MTKKEATTEAILYLWTKRHGYSDLLCAEYMPPEVREILYRNRRRLNKFYRRHIKKRKFFYKSKG